METSVGGGTVAYVPSGATYQGGRRRITAFRPASNDPMASSRRKGEQEAQDQDASQGGYPHRGSRTEVRFGAVVVDWRRKLARPASPLSTRRRSVAKGIPGDRRWLTSRCHVQNIVCGHRLGQGRLDERSHGIVLAGAMSLPILDEAFQDRRECRPLTFPGASFDDRPSARPRQVQGNRTVRAIAGLVPLPARRSLPSPERTRSGRDGGGSAPDPCRNVRGHTRPRQAASEGAQIGRQGCPDTDCGFL